MPKEKKPKKDPTPWLNLPRPDRKLFTYSENQLLDQITTEVVHAWTADLKIIKKANAAFTEKASIVYAFCEKFYKFLPLFDKLFTSEEYQELRESDARTKEEINARLCELNKNAFEVTEIVKKLREVKCDYDAWKKETVKPKSPWWKRLFAK